MLTRQSYLTVPHLSLTINLYYQSPILTGPKSDTSAKLLKVKQMKKFLTELYEIQRVWDIETQAYKGVLFFDYEIMTMQLPLHPRRKS